MQCNNCGLQLNDDAKFCTRCGTPLVREQTAYQENIGYTLPEECETVTSGTYTDDYTDPHTNRGFSQDMDPSDRNAWMAGLALTCSILSLCTFFLIIPGILLGIAAVVFALLSKNTSLRPVSILALILGCAGIMASSIFLVYAAAIASGAGRFIRFL